MKLIDKDALVAEIERRIKALNEILSRRPISWPTLEKLIEENKKVLSFLNTLEVKEVDLEKELNDFITEQRAWIRDDRTVEYNNGDSFNHIYDLEELAKHFFELGMAQHQNIWHPMSEIIDHPCTILMHGYRNDVWICDAIDMLQQSTAQEWAYIDDVLLLLGLKAQKGEQL